MGEKMQPMPEEISEEEFQKVTKDLESAGSEPESPPKNEELLRMWEEEKKRIEQGYQEPPAVWQNKEQFR